MNQFRLPVFGHSHEFRVKVVPFAPVSLVETRSRDVKFPDHALDIQERCPIPLPVHNYFRRFSSKVNMRVHAAFLLLVLVATLALVNAQTPSAPPSSEPA